MISIIGPEGTPEYNYACRLRDLILTEWSGVDEDALDDIRIVAAVKCHGQSTTDIDMVVFVLLSKLRPIPFSESENDDKSEKDIIFIHSLCLTIELKNHYQDSVIFDGNQVKVRYGDHIHSATEQSHKQQAALRDFYKQHGLKLPFVTNLIWLPNIPQACLPEVDSNILGDKATWGDFLRCVVNLRKPRPELVAGIQEINAFSHANAKQTAQVVDLLTKRLEMSSLDRLKVERISRERARQASERQYMEKMGQQLLIFKGRGGTGKTLRLLQLAHDLYIEQDARVLILTYNKALVADLQRLFALIGAGSGDARHTIVIKTVHAFLYRIAEYSGVTHSKPEQFITQIDRHKQNVLKYLRKIRSQQNDPLDIFIAASSDHFNWDYIFIDEAQDWPEDERDMLFLLYDFRHFVLADGVDQMVRGGYHTHWRDVINKQQSQVVTLRKSLRLKAGLCQFAHAVARQLDLPNWQLDPDDDMYGGRVIILEGLYSEERSFHDQLMSLTQHSNNHPIDMLFCVPPSLVNKEHPEKVYSYVASRFQKWGYNTWDGTADHVRSSYPTNLDQIRVVQYESCRGLEGWMCVNLGFDELYDYKKQKYIPPAQTTFEFRDEERESHLFAASWLMIPLTRAIDTLVIQIRSADHYIAQVLKAAAQECPNIVEWRKVALAEPTEHPLPNA